MNIISVAFSLLLVLILFSVPPLAGSASAQSAPVSTSAVQSIGCIDYLSKIVHEGCTVAAAIDLTTKFHTPGKWSFLVTQGTSNEDEAFAIGQLMFCFINNSRPECGVNGDDIKKDSMDHRKLDPNAPSYNQLDSANVIYPSPTAKTPVLVVITRALAGGPGDGRYDVTIWGYDPHKRNFREIFFNSSYANILEETRVITTGQLAGYIVVDKANVTHRWPWPFGITVYKFISPDCFFQVLDFIGKANQAGGFPVGNIIDIETPAILARLGLESKTQ